MTSVDSEACNALTLISRLQIDPNYITILREMTKHEINIILDETKKFRAKRLSPDLIKTSDRPGRGRTSSDLSKRAPSGKSTNSEGPRGCSRR